jgi:hypothetical protein
MASPPGPSGRPSRSQAAGVAVWSHKDVAIFLIGVIGAGVASLVGVFTIPREWLFLCCVGIAALAALVVRSFQVRTNKQRINALRLALAVAVAIPAGAAIYHQWLDPARNTHASYPLQAGGTDVQIARPADAPGGTPGYDYPPVIGGSTVQVSCYVDLSGSGRWYWIYGEQGWLPQADLRPIPGLAPPAIPHC